MIQSLFVGKMMKPLDYSPGRVYEIMALQGLVQMSGKQDFPAKRAEPWAGCS